MEEEMAPDGVTPSLYRRNDDADSCMRRMELLEMEERGMEAMIEDEKNYNYEVEI